MGLCAYCSDCEVENSYLTCTVCRKCVHVSCLKSGSVPGGLLGDAFFDFVCQECSVLHNEHLKRQKIPWFIVIALTLYNLHKRSVGTSLKGYFHYKIHIGNFIDMHWSIIFEPSFKRKKSWMGTVSGTLSHFCPTYFLNGNEVLKDNGWWRLTDPCLTPQQIFEIHMKNQSTKKKSKLCTKLPDCFLLPESALISPHCGILNESSMSTCEYESNKPGNSRDLSNLELEEDTDSPTCSFSADLLGGWQVLKPSDSLFSGRSLQPNKTFSDCLFNVDENLADMDIDIDVNMNSLDLVDTRNEDFQEVDFFLRPDVNPPEATVCGFPAVLSYMVPGRLFSNADISSINSLCGDEIVSREGMLETDADNENNEYENIAEELLTSSLFVRTHKEKRILPGDVKKSAFKKPSEKRYIPMSVYEELQLLNHLRRAAIVKELPPYVRRLYRKLCVRRLKREQGMSLFNMDNILLADMDLWQSSSAWARSLRNTSGCQTRETRILDRFYHVASSAKEEDQKHRCCSFKFRLMGYSEPTCFISPYTHRQLKPFIRRDYETTPLWLKLLAEIQTKGNRNKPEWQPSPRCPIDFSYVRPQHISTINSLCSECFYPGIDLSEALQYPDFSCVVLYKKLIVGFAFMVPDVGFNETYITFLFTRVEWRGAGIGSFMLYHLIQTCMGKDVTLHVSATNPALILYQKFGFKVEEFVQDFYDKYFPADTKECKHALFLRLSR